MTIQDDNARDTRIKTKHVENLRIVTSAHRTAARIKPTESAPQRFKRLVREMDIARAARDARGPAPPAGTLSLWKRNPV